MNQGQAGGLRQPHLGTADTERDGTAWSHPEMLQSMILTLIFPLPIPRPPLGAESHGERQAFPHPTKRPSHHPKQRVAAVTGLNWGGAARKGPGNRRAGSEQVGTLTGAGRAMHEPRGLHLRNSHSEMKCFSISS